MAMYGVLQRYDTISPAVEEATQRINEGVTILAQGAPGFVSHRILDLRNGVLLSITAFEDEASARDWAFHAVKVLDQRLQNLLAAPTETTVGRIHDRKRASTHPAAFDRRVARQWSSSLPLSMITSRSEWLLAPVGR